MSEKSVMCYELGYCYFCKKVDCEKRIYKSSYTKTTMRMCDGNCYECNEAIRGSLYTKLYTLGVKNRVFSSCLLYQYFSEMKTFSFYGRVGKISDYSKIELAILQLKKCNDCEEKKKYFDVLKEISWKIRQIPHCFEIKTELTSTKALEMADSCIKEVLKHDYNCKVEIVLKRLIKEYLAANDDNEIDLEKMCEYITSNQIDIDYFVHPVTVNTLLSEN